MPNLGTGEEKMNLHKHLSSFFFFLFPRIEVFNHLALEMGKMSAHEILLLV
jgi:hypothetical protein